jgi:putative flippase GtrA
MEVLLGKFFRFCIVGISGLIIDFGATWILKERGGVNKYIANSVGFILAASSNYLLNRCWTFCSEDSRIVAQYLTFVMISLAGLGISNSIVFLFSEKFKINFYLSKLIAIVAVTLWNFGLNCLITFR